LTFVLLLSRASTDDLALQLSECIGNLAKIYATTTIIYFCINCAIIANEFSNLANQIKKMSEKSFTTIFWFRSPTGSSVRLYGTNKYYHENSAEIERN